MKTSSTTLAAIFLVLGQQQICAEQSITTLPVLSHHHILKRRNLHSTVPGVTKQNIPIVRKLSAGVNDEEDEVSTLEVGGLYQGYGTHYVDLWIGTPTPQRQTVIVDTGSGITAFPCQGCRDCGKEYHASDFFDESQSESYTKMTCDTCVDATCRNQGTNEEYCHVSVSYQEGSMWAAHEGRDRTYLGGLHDGPLKYKEEGTKLGGMIHGEDPLEATNFGFDMTFGCQTKITGLFKTQLADGIMGMCLKESSIFQQMYQQNVIQNPSFSLCFVRGEDAAKEGTTAGALTMGGTDSLLHASPMVFARGFKTKGVMHGVSIRQVHIMEAGQYRAMNATSSNTHTVKITQASLNTGSVIVDSGTTDTYFTRNLSDPFKIAFKSVTGFSYNENGMTLTEEEVNKLPTILIQLEGVVGTDSIGGLAYKIDPQNPGDVLLAIPPAHYIEYDTGSKHYIGRFSMSEGRGSVIGANTMRGHDVFFDIPSSGSIGFAESDCDYSRLSGLTVPEVVTEPSDSKGQSISTDDDDEYYETENSKLAKDVIQPSSTSESKHSCDDKCTRGAIGFGFVAGAIVIFAVYKKVVNRHRAMYGKAITETEHLNDLVLDTEIQLTEIS
eukprot:scaffold1094_cov241-Chaetoceros_neogracile.AAC.2